MFRKSKGFSVLLPTAGMEACRLYAAAAIFLLIFGSALFPFVPAGLSLVAAMILSRGLLRVRLRRIAFAFFHLAGFVIAAALVLKFYGGLPFTEARAPSDWAEAFRLMGGAADWAAFWLILIWTGVFWLRGALIGAGEVSHAVTVGRFDVGVGVLLFAYFVRMGIRQEDPLAIHLAAAYFLFGIVALYAARGLSLDEDFLGSRSVLGLLAPFAAGFLFLGAAVVILYPWFAQAAGEAYTVLRRGAAPLAPWIVALIRFLFGFGFRGMAADPSSGAQEGESRVPSPEEPGFWARLIEGILAWGFLGIIAVLAVSLTGWLIWRFVKYLLARPGGEFGVSLRAFLRDILAAVSEYLRRLVRGARGLARSAASRFSARGKPSGAGAAGFRRLSSWGRLSGLPRGKAETAAEYGRRLASRFPAAAGDAELLVRQAEAEFYGGRRLTRESERLIRRARRGLARPALYPARLASRLGLRRLRSGGGGKEG